MKLTELKNWDQLTPQEQARLREIYGDEDLGITKTMHDAISPQTIARAKADEGEKNG